MANYSRTFLHFLHALSESRQRVHTFLFGTRLTNVTRQLRNKDPDEALADCTDAVEDWSGGTRIGTTLARVQQEMVAAGFGAGRDCPSDHRRAGTRQDDLLDKEIDRLHRSCRRLIWLNPLLRFDGFQARAKGIRTMLPHVDEFRAVHSLEALADLCVALSRPATRENDPRVWLETLS